MYLSSHGSETSLELPDQRVAPNNTYLIHDLGDSAMVHAWYLHSYLHVVNICIGMLKSALEKQPKFFIEGDQSLTL